MKNMCVFTFLPVVSEISFFPGGPLLSHSLSRKWGSGACINVWVCSLVVWLFPPPASMDPVQEAMRAEFIALVKGLYPQVYDSISREVHTKCVVVPPHSPPPIVSLYSHVHLTLCCVLWTVSQLQGVGVRQSSSYRANRCRGLLQPGPPPPPTSAPSPSPPPRATGGSWQGQRWTHQNVVGINSQGQWSQCPSQAFRLAAAH